jgi:hypothetical protein
MFTLLLRSDWLASWPNLNAGGFLPEAYELGSQAASLFRGIIHEKLPRLRWRHYDPSKEGCPPIVEEIGSDAIVQARTI